MCVLCIISHYLYYALHGVFLENELSIYHAATTPLSRCEEAEQPDPSSIKPNEEKRAFTSNQTLIWRRLGQEIIHTNK
jgi:hypothetical protein